MGLSVSFEGAPAGRASRTHRPTDLGRTSLDTALRAGAMVLRWGGCLFVVFLMISDDLRDAMFDDRLRSEWQRWILLVTVLATLLVTLVHTRFPPSLGPPEAVQRPNKDILAAMDEAAARYDSDAIALFRDILLNMQNHVTRVDEKVRTVEKTIELDTTANFVLRPLSAESPGRSIQRSPIQRPQGPLSRLLRRNPPVSAGRQPGVALVPIIRLQKGVLLDNLEVRDGYGATLPVLPRRDVEGLMAHLVNGLYVQAYAPRLAGKHLIHYENADLTRVMELIQLVCSVGRQDGRDDLPDSILRDLPRSPRNPHAAEQLEALCRFYFDRYAVVVELPPSTNNRAVISHRRTLPYSYSKIVPAPEGSQRKRRLLRPNEITVPIPWSAIASSYHFRADAPDGQYVADQYLQNGETAEPVTQESFQDVGDHRPYLRLRHRCGLPYAHLYTRDLNKLKGHQKKLTTTVEFAEVPFGALGGALIVAFVTLVLVLFFTTIQPGLDCVYQNTNCATGAGSGGGINADLPALILTLPAFAASWLGLAANDRNLITLSKEARYGLSVAAIISLTSALLYIAQANNHMLNTPKFMPPMVNNLGFFGDWRVHTLSTPWLLLSTGAMVLTFGLAVLMLRRWFAYYLARRRLVRHSGIHE